MKMMKIYSGHLLYVDIPWIILTTITFYEFMCTSFHTFVGVGVCMGGDTYMNIAKPGKGMVL
jgi:hypothetical protein